MSNSPANPIEAVTHPDPYPYYESLRPVHYDENLAMWIVSSAEAVASVMTSDLCRVRPVNEPVPMMLIGSPAGEIFRHLVRMDDGAAHCPAKRSISGAIGSVKTIEAESEARRWARTLADELGPAANTARITDFAFRLPVYTMASLLGFPPGQLGQIAAWTGKFAACLAPGAESEQIENGNAAAGCLLDSFQRLLGRRSGRLLSGLAQIARDAGIKNEDMVIANGIGLLSQAYEAAAGLIGNTLVALGRRGDVLAEVRARPGLLTQTIEEVSRFDPSVQNTRRFVADDGIIAGHDMKMGDTVLVVLAAANRDPAANTDPSNFDIFREERRSFTFGAGAHACPGERLAVTIAAAGVRQLLGSGIEPGELAAAYRNSVNTRIPLFI